MNCFRFEQKKGKLLTKIQRVFRPPEFSAGALWMQAMVEDQVESKPRSVERKRQTQD